MEISAEVPPVPEGPPPGEIAPTIPLRNIAGFWRRTFALISDWIVLAVPAFVAGFLAFDFFANLGPLCLVAGLAVWVAYFGVGNSRIAGGQTLGKRVLGIKVVSRSGQELGLGASTIRAGVLGLPIYLPGLIAPVVSPGGWSAASVGTVSFVLVFLTIYLIIFNRRTRQTVHDLAVRSYVTIKSVETEPYPQQVWRGHLVIGAALVLVMMGGGYLGVSALMTALDVNETDMNAMFSLQRELLEEFPAHAAEIQLQQSWSTQHGTLSTTIVTLHWSLPIQDLRLETDRVAEFVFSHFEPARERDVLVVQLVRGFSFGFASLNSSHHMTYDAEVFSAGANVTQ